MKRRLAVILMADMVDYSRLMEADQAGAIGLVRELRERWLEPEAEKRGGEVLKRMGDGWIIAFNSVTDAVETAQTVQTALSGHGQIQLRIASHLGEIADDGTDIYGSGINITARLQIEAPPGGVMISEDLHRQLDARLAQGFADAGAFTLKNIDRPVTGFQWRPAARNRAAANEVPVIGIEPLTAMPDTAEARDAAVDLQEQLVHNLSRRTGIRVLAMDGEVETTPTYVLRGRLRSRGDTAKATLSLILRATGQVTWSRVFEGRADDLLSLSDLAAERADNDLRVEINAFDGERLTELPDEALSASELRTRAAHLFYSTTVEGYERALGLLDRALRLAPGNAMSLAMWAHARARLTAARFETLDPADLAQIAARADEAVQAAPRSDFAFKVRAEVRLDLLGDVDGARRAIARVKQINPGYTLLHLVEAGTELATGAYDRAVEVMERGLARSEQDPFRPGWSYATSVACLLAGRLEDALRHIEDAIELRPGCPVYWLLLAEIRARAGAPSDAAEARARAAGLPDGPDILAPWLPLPAAEQGLMADLAPTGVASA